MYSYNTSLPAYKENKADKDSQAERILNFIVLAKYTTLKQLEEVTGCLKVPYQEEFQT
jgi:hypothetical protein